MSEMNLEHPEHGVAVPEGTTDVLDAEVTDMTERLDIDLKVADRCDTAACGAQAFVVTLHSGFPLLWCAHHYEAAERKPDSTIKNHLVIDARPEINTSASMSANAV